MFQATKLGLFDIIGNVWEYCLDWFDVDYYSVSPAENPCGPYEGVLRFIRGGSWRHARWNSRNATRGRVCPTESAEDIGFRVVISVDALQVPNYLKDVKFEYQTIGSGELPLVKH